jgi:hypothetical protein
MNMKKASIFFLLILIIAACSPKTAAVVETTAQPEEEEKVEAPAAAQAAPSPACTSDATPQEVTFKTTDGQATLDGLFYPACNSGAPVVVLMHWVGGDKSDWYEIAAWLQNRGLANPFTNPDNSDWWDPSWFPKIDPAVSYNVFIFSFRGCEPYPTGCTTMQKSGWLLDAQAAMQQATQLAGVDPARAAAIGSSIGADGAADSCLWLNEQKSGTCRGALSLSPGDYLGVSYADTVKKLGEMQPPTAAWCLADEKEIGVCEKAAAAGNPAYEDFLIPDGQHGNMLLRPGLVPLPMQTILDFLDEAFTS